MSFQEIQCSAAKLRLADPAVAPLLLDVREERELAICRISGAIHIPMGQVPARLGELGRDREIIVFCHHGKRSQMVAGFLSSQGFERVYSLAGGIDAWSREVDGGVARY